MSKETFDNMLPPEPPKGAKAPNRFLPFFFRDFFDEVEGEPEYILGAYLRAVGRYWGDNCAGIPANPIKLQKLCHLTDEQWIEVGQTIFGKFFYFDGELWQHQRLRSQWEEVEPAYAKRMKGAAATKLKYELIRQGKLAPTDGRQG
jgi:uncharacterized protein YdaU (DUF1376 family)